MSIKYGQLEWEADLKMVLMEGGLEARPLLFLLTNSQVREDAWWQDLTNLLQSGEVPTLFNASEKQEVAVPSQICARE